MLSEKITDTKKYLLIAKKMIKKLKRVEEESDKKGHVTSAFLRKLLEFSKEEGISTEEIKVKVGYLVARNTKGRNCDLEIFYFDLKRELDKMKSIPKIQKFFEYLIYFFTIRAKLGEIECL
ncbi:MAG: hypothetical protein ACTSRA_11655 [Promethearchaeota archaeon]